MVSALQTQNHYKYLGITSTTDKYHIHRAIHRRKNKILEKYNNGTIPQGAAAEAALELAMSNPDSRQALRRLVLIHTTLSTEEGRQMYADRHLDGSYRKNEHKINTTKLTAKDRKAIVDFSADDDQIVIDHREELLDAVREKEAETQRVKRDVAAKKEESDQAKKARAAATAPPLRQNAHFSALGLVAEMEGETVAPARKAVPARKTCNSPIPSDASTTTTSDSPPAVTTPSPTPNTTTPSSKPDNGDLTPPSGLSNSPTAGKPQPTHSNQPSTTRKRKHDDDSDYSDRVTKELKIDGASETMDTEVVYSQPFTPQMQQAEQDLYHKKVPSYKTKLVGAPSGQSALIQRIQRQCSRRGTNATGPNGLDDYSLTPNAELHRSEEVFEQLRDQIETHIQLVQGCFGGLTADCKYVSEMHSSLKARIALEPQVRNVMDQMDPLLKFSQYLSDKLHREEAVYLFRHFKNADNHSWLMAIDKAMDHFQDQQKQLENQLDKLNEFCKKETAKASHGLNSYELIGVYTRMTANILQFEQDILNVEQLRSRLLVLLPHVQNIDEVRSNPNNEQGLKQKFDQWMKELTDENNQQDFRKRMQRIKACCAIRAQQNKHFLAKHNMGGKVPSPSSHRLFTGWQRIVLNKHMVDYNPIRPKWALTRRGPNISEFEGFQIFPTKPDGAKAAADGTFGVSCRVSEVLDNWNKAFESSAVADPIVRSLKSDRVQLPLSGPTKDSSSGFSSKGKDDRSHPSKPSTTLRNSQADSTRNAKDVRDTKPTRRSHSKDSSRHTDGPRAYDSYRGSGTRDNQRSDPDPRRRRVDSWRPGC
ncbi:hypothetical protein EJ08DRAFT_660567 [Tothia fuscella]|uniref:Uncharacterized protein n=1 Tax=Tothia fuscella TaxID=1048955 RepID=A0A9P4NSK0_9PEZI|nr:hypothetical protein EJ08DRAFT_660567 [Tothia fuscella]